MSEPKLPEVRVSPAGVVVIRRFPDGAFPWRAWNLDAYTDAQVAGWTPLVPAADLVAELVRNADQLDGWGWSEAADMLRERVTELLGGERR